MIESRWLCGACNTIVENLEVCFQCNSAIIAVGNFVNDNLTSSNAEVLEVFVDAKGNKGFRIDNDHLGGLRHSWEIK